MPESTEAPAPRPTAPHLDDTAPDVVAARLAAVVSRLLRKLRTESSASLLTPSQRSVLARLDGDEWPPRRRSHGRSTCARSPCG